MKYKAILFDMDGTLLPMDMDEFTKGYFSLLAKKLMPFGIEKEKLVPAIWDGTASMVKNDGKTTNDRVFWKRFEEVTGISEEVIGDACTEYYGNEFHQARVFTKDNPLAIEAVKAARAKADIVILATNPIFPMPGQITRMGWLGLKPEDFDLVTSYESDSYSKPNPNYFLSICERMNINPEECLMIGNDEREDMLAASSVGMDCYLVTDYMVKNEKHPWNGPKGTFAEMIEMINSL